MLDKEFALQEAVLGLIHAGSVRSAHDVSEGGLFITLFESARVRGLGFDAAQGDNKSRKDAFWFGESQSRVVVSVSADQAASLEKTLASKGVPCTRIGVVSSGSVKVDGQDWGHIGEWSGTYENVIGDHMGGYMPE